MKVKITKEIEVPSEIMVGDVPIPISKDPSMINRAEYQGWLNMVDSDRWGNVNIIIDLKTMAYTVYLDYGSKQTEDGESVLITGKVRSLTPMHLNRVIGNEIIRAYPFIETMDDPRLKQNKRR